MQAVVTSVCSSPTHTMAKFPRAMIRLLAGLGVEGDAHLGANVQHRSRLARDPAQPNLRQVHLIHAELHDELATMGFQVSPGLMGENITTRGIDLLGLPKDTCLRLGSDAVVQVTGLRNPCTQLDGIQPGLMAATLARDREGQLIRKAGVMAIVVNDGFVKAGDPIIAQLPPPPRESLKPI